MNCRKAYEQYARTVRLDIAKLREFGTGAGIGAKKLMQLDTVSAELLAQQRQLCIDYNNCILSRDEYKKEAAFLRRAQLKIRHAAAQLPGGPPGAEGGAYAHSEPGGSGPPKAPPAFEHVLADIIADLFKDKEESGSGGGNYDTGGYDQGGYPEGSYDEGVYDQGDDSESTPEQ
jgi:hypothetical protein